MNPEKSSSSEDLPAVSVILCSFNAVFFIADAIDSILNQTLDNFELLIVDDGSTDGTREVIEKYSDPRIKYFPMERNMGIVYARNYAINLARGKFIALMDHDDISDESRLLCQVDHLEATGSDICSAFYFELNNATGKLRKRKSFTSSADLRALLCVYSPLINPAIMLRKSSVDGCCYKSEFEFAEDYALWCDLSLTGAKFTCCPKFLFTYRVHPKQMTQTRMKNNKNLSDVIRLNYIHKLIGSEVLPTSLRLIDRVVTGGRFLWKLNKVIPGISIQANYEIYARYQFRGNGILTPLVRVERLIVASLMTIVGIVFKGDPIRQNEISGS